MRRSLATPRLWLLLIAACGVMLIWQKRSWPDSSAGLPEHSHSAPPEFTETTPPPTDTPELPLPDTASNPERGHEARLPPLKLALGIGKALGRGWRGGGFDAWLAAAAAAPQATFDAAAATLQAGNTSTARAALLERMALIDFLGVAASAHPYARRQLFAFALSPIASRTDPYLTHLDVTDRLEAFVYVAALAPDAAARHVKRQPGANFKSKFVVQYVAGREHAGRSRAEAIQEAFDTFGSDHDLAFAHTKSFEED